MIRLLCLVAVLVIIVNPRDLPAQDLSGDVPGQAQPARDEILAAAKEAETAKRFDQAARLYGDYLQRRPEDDEVRALLARVLSWQGKYAEAVTLYEEILSRHPVDLDVRVALARVRSWQQRFEEAIGLYTGVLNEDPKNVEAKQGLADTLYWSKHYQEALPLYREVYEETQIRRSPSGFKPSPRSSPCRPAPQCDAHGQGRPFRFEIMRSSDTATSPIPINSQMNVTG